MLKDYLKLHFIVLLWGFTAILGKLLTVPPVEETFVAAQALGVQTVIDPFVPPERWAPYGVPAVLLGDQEAACRLTRARHCPVPGHPCLDGIDPGAVVAAVATLQASSAGDRDAVPARPREVDHVR